jgi:DNA-binding NtrC family response regulator
MTNPTQTILVVNPDAEKRTLLARQLSSAGFNVKEADQGTRALRLMKKRDIRLVISELYLKTGESDCLIQAVRQNRLRGTRVLAHTVHAKSADLAWAKRWGASGFLIQPTAARLKRALTLLMETAQTASPRRARKHTRFATLDGALGKLEQAGPRGVSSIVLARTWWSALTLGQRNDYRRRAKRAGVTLHSDSMMSSSFVELRTSGRRNVAH